MAGASIKVTFDDAEVVRALDRLAGAGKDLAPAMREIGEHLLNTTRQRFTDEEAPDGTPWAPLSETTKRRKRRNAEKILTESGALRGHGLVYRAGRDRVEVGSPLIYAGTHQFGAAKGAFGPTPNPLPNVSGEISIPWGDIPARPFLGVSDDDPRKILAIVNDHLTEHLR